MGHVTEFFVIDHPPVVELIGLSQPIPEAIQKVMDYRGNFWNTDPIENDPLALAEFGGRVCYESFDNKKNRSRIDYIKDTALNKQHGSIIEHVWFNFAVLDLPRNALMELTRHRVGVAYSWRSTRYIDNWICYSIPPMYRENEALVNLFRISVKTNFRDYNMLKATSYDTWPDAPKKQHIEAARGILAGSATSDGEFSVNLRELLHILNLRSAKGADKSMQEFAQALYNAAEPYVKEFFDVSTT